MKTLGMIGGIGPESTIAYYREIICAYREITADGDAYPSLVINSIDLRKMLDLVAADDRSGLSTYLVGEVKKLARAGAKLGLLAANTPHVVFDDVGRLSPIPLVSIVEATCDVAQRRGFTRVALFGTRFTMQGRFYPEVFSKAGIEVIVPRDDEQAFIHDRYMGELVKGTYLPRTRESLLRIVDLLKERERVEAVILAGTELPLILTETTASGIPVLDTTRIHVREAVTRLWSR